MPDVAIRVEGLGKRYRIGAPAMNYRTLRDSFIDALRVQGRGLLPSASAAAVLVAGLGVKMLLEALESHPGVVAEKGEGHAIVDVGGIGYRVHLSQVTLSALPPVGEKVLLRTYTHVREDALQLFGFGGEEEESVFHELMGVKNVGPRAALNILSGIEPRDLARAVADGDVARLTKVPGIGKKTAERLVVELKEKLVALARAAAPKAAAGSGPFEQLEQALLGLGFKPAQATAAVDALRDQAEGKRVDELLREALQLLRVTMAETNADKGMTYAYVECELRIRCVSEETFFCTSPALTL